MNLVWLAHFASIQPADATDRHPTTDYHNLTGLVLLTGNAVRYSWRINLAAPTKHALRVLQERALLDLYGNYLAFLTFTNG